MRYAGTIRHLHLVRPQPNAAVEQVAKQFASLDPALVFRAGFKLDFRADAPPAGLLQIGRQVLQVPGPFNAPVLARHGSRLTLTTEQDGPAWSDADWAVTLGPGLLRDGQLAEREWRNPAVQIQPDARRPRVALGWRDSVLLVYHGVATIPEVARWFQGRVDDAIACDGGSGTQWWYRGTVGRLDDGVAILPSAFILRGEVEDVDTDRWASVRGKNTPTRVIIHHGGPGTESWNAGRIDLDHKAKGWLGIGYHWVVLRDGRIEPGRPEDAEGAHALGANRDSLGVCLPGDFSQSPPPPRQLEAAVDLVAGICARHGFGVDRIFGHRDVQATQCPGQRFDLAAFRQAVAQRLAPPTDELARLRADNAALQARLTALEARLAKIRAALED